MSFLGNLEKVDQLWDITESTDYVSIVLSLDTSTEVVFQEKRVWSDGIPSPFESLKFCTDGLKN